MIESLLIVKRYSFLVLCLAFFSSESWPASRDPAFEITPNDAVVAVINNRAVRLKLLGTGAAGIFLNPDVAGRLNLKPLKNGVTGSIGPVRIAGQSSRAMVTVAGASASNLVRWFDRPIVSGFDGAIGPAGLPQTKVTFRLAERTPTHSIRTIPLTVSKHSFGTVGSVVRFGNNAVELNFDFERPDSLVTAAAGQLIAQYFGGNFTGPTMATEIRMGVRRPVRRLKMAQPLHIAQLSLNTLNVRTGDEGSVAGIPDTDGVDTAEIIITAPSGKKPVSYILLGKDALGKCSSVTFDKSAKQIVLECRE